MSYKERSVSVQPRCRITKIEPVKLLSVHALICVPLFVFSLSDPKQNARSLLKPVSGTVFHALSNGSLGFALHGSTLNHFLIGQNS